LNEREEATKKTKGKCCHKSQKKKQNENPGMELFIILIANEKSLLMMLRGEVRMCVFLVLI
jgi:hypothetical protein